jgi:hypothetical protein
MNALIYSATEYLVSAQREKVHAILEMNYPGTLGDAWVVLGEFGYHRKFVLGYSIIVSLSRTL